VLALHEQAGVVVNKGTIGFEGSTVPGELRELCGIRLLAVHPNPSILPAGECLPRVFSKKGYTTFGIHGFIGTLFSRNRWYPVLGFDNIWFAPEIDEKLTGANRCGIAFHGVCDTDLWKMIVEVNSETAEQKNFFYWLTLSAHLPVEYPKDTNLAVCVQFEALVEHKELCYLVLQQRQLFSEIAISITKGELNNTRILLVGDHAPPLLNNETRALFSEELVPYVDIQILDIGIPGERYPMGAD
jgi:phosphoglycerol transferase MdoB-like AlkP superfamily enzyme